MLEAAPKNSLRAEGFRRTRLLVDQLSDGTFNEVANQLSILVNAAELQAKNDLCGQIARLLFAKATRDTTDLACLRLCAQICHRLKIGDARRNGDETLFKPSALVHEHLYRLCDDFLMDASRRTQGGIVDAGRGASRTPNKTSNRLNKIAPERVTLFVGELFEAGAMPAACLQDYMKHLIKSQNSISLESRLVGLSQLMETHGQRLDTGPLKDTMDLVFAWIEGVIEGARLAKRVNPQLLDQLKVSITTLSGF